MHITGPTKSTKISTLLWIFIATSIIIKMVFNSVKSGEDLAKNQLSEAKQNIQEDFEANEQYSKLAEASAKSMLAALIRGINPDVEDLEVEVEFY